jgi:hypothetical protein
MIWLIDVRIVSVLGGLVKYFVSSFCFPWFPVKIGEMYNQFRNVGAYFDHQALSSPAAAKHGLASVPDRAAE